MTNWILAPFRHVWEAMRLAFAISALASEQRTAFEPEPASPTSPVPSLVDTIFDGAEEEWRALSAGRQLATIALIAIAAVALGLELIG